MKVAYLGPPGTYSEEALGASVGGRQIEAIPEATIFEAVDAVEQGRAERAFVPFENSIEGAVRSTLDALAFDTSHVVIAGEYDHPIRHNLIAREQLPLERIEVICSHPQANAQCARFVRERLPGATVRGAASTSDAVRQVAESEEPWAALGSAAAARAYGCVILSEGVEDTEDNITRFVWLAGGEEGPGPAAGEDGRWRTSLFFSELGDDRPGALVEALTEFSSRGVNLIRIESRPLRLGLGRYLFFIDLEGNAHSGVIAEAIGGLRGKAETVRILGSYRLGSGPPL